MVADAAPGDVVGLMCHAERGEAEAWLRAVGATVADPQQIRAKVLAARGEVEVDGRHGSA
jgi:cyanophycin synthetase